MRGDHLARNQQHMHRGLRVNVAEGQAMLVLIDDLRRYFLFDDLEEQVVGHHGIGLRFARFGMVQSRMDGYNPRPAGSPPRDAGTEKMDKAHNAGWLPAWRMLPALLVPILLAGCPGARF